MSRADLTLREAGPEIPLQALDSQTSDLEVRERWRKQVFQRSRRLQELLGLREMPLVIRDREDGPTLRTVGLAGTLRLGSFEIDIAPKYMTDQSATEWHRSLIAMMERIARRRADYSLSDGLDLGPTTFLDYFGYSYAVALEHATRREAVRLYTSRRERSPVLRGRLLVADQLRSALTAPHLLVCEVDRLDADNPINRLVRWAGTYLLTVVTDGRVRRYLSHQLDRLPDVATPRPPVPFRASLPPQFSHYSTAVDLALALSRAQGPNPSTMAAVGAGFVVGTERLFEQFIERSLAVISHTAPWSAIPQRRERFAEPLPGNVARAFFSKPDNVVQVNSTTRLVVDAKYKRFEDATEDSHGSRPTNADLYQLAAASVAHGCSRALAVYPKLSATEVADGPIRWWQVSGWADKSLRIGVMTVDLDILGERHGIQRFDTRLRDRIEEALL